MNKVKQTARPHMIIIEGVDRTGKDTLQQSLNKMTDYKNMVMIRGPIGFLAYAQLYNKDVPEEQYLAMEEQFKYVDHLVVHLTADTDDLLGRFIATNEVPLREEASIKDRRTILENHKEVHAKFYRKSQLKKMQINTSGKTSEEVAAQVVTTLNLLSDTNLAKML